MNKNYVVFRNYNGMKDGYLAITNKRHSYEYNLVNATRFTLKQANKLVFQLNAEMKRNYSYYYRYGYMEIK